MERYLICSIDVTLKNKPRKSTKNILSKSTSKYCFISNVNKTRLYNNIRDGKLEPETKNTKCEKCTFYINGLRPKKKKISNAEK